MEAKELGEPIAGTGNLYEWGEHQILKLYGPDVPREFVKQLGQREKDFYEAGLPVPEVGELIEIDDGLGQVYEKIEGQSFADELLAIKDGNSERIDQLAHDFAELHAKIHSCQDIQAELPQQKGLFPIVLQRIDVLPAALREATLKALEEMPDGDRLCHGDFHPYNVLQSPLGAIVIDWNNSHIGNPLEDVARSKLMLVGLSRMVPSISDIIVRFTEVYLDRYFQLRRDGQEQLEAWWPIVSAVRLIDNIPELQDWLLGQIRAGFGQ